MNLFVENNEQSRRDNFSAKSSRPVAYYKLDPTEDNALDT